MSNSSIVLTQILVVDDEDVVREPLMEALGWVGYSADGAHSVDKALDCLNRKQYDLVFCDIMMPETNGFVLMDVIRRQYPTLPVVVLTGHATVDLTQKAIGLGAKDFVIKPFSVRELPFIVERNLERARLEAQIREQQTETILFQTVQALAAAIEAKDPYTAGHSQKVASLALQIAAKIPLSSTDMFVIRLAGLMHDVGKIGIPESVLLKPGQLSQPEWEIMKQHPVIGAEIVGQITDLGYVAQVVRSHHERWDGKGYPDGLTGEAIPLLSRILYIADAFDALTADRAYRKSLTRQQALEILQRQSGVQFDAELVGVLAEQVFPSLQHTNETDALLAKLSRTTQESLVVQAAYSEQDSPVC